MEQGGLFVTIPSFRKGEKLKAADLQSLADAVRANRVLPGAGIRVTGSPNGTTVAATIKKGTSAAEGVHPFQAIYPAPFTGTGEPPVSQKLKFKVRPGIVSSGGGPRLAANLNEEFTAPGESDRYYCWIEAAFTSNGEVVALSEFKYAAGNAVPEITMSETPDDVYPTKWFLPLFAVKTKDGGITDVEQYIQTSLSISIVVVSVECARQRRQVFWSSL